MARHAAQHEASTASLSANRQCPGCGGKRVHRSHRRILEKCTAWMHSGKRKYRCHDCQHVFWQLKVQPDNELTGAPTRTIDVVASGGIKSKRFRRNDHSTPYQRFQEMLYRKHSLTVGVLVILLLIAVLAIFFTVSVSRRLVRAGQTIAATDSSRLRCTPLPETRHKIGAVTPSSPQSL